MTTEAAALTAALNEWQATRSPESNYWDVVEMNDEDVDIEASEQMDYGVDKIAMEDGTLIVFRPQRNDWIHYDDTDAVAAELDA